MIYFILPIYNEENNIRKIIPDLRRMMQGEDYRIVAVNDGSSDGSLAVLREYLDRDILMEGSLINMNIGAAFSLAIDRVLFESRDPDDVMLIMESDQTSELGLVQRMVSALREEQADVVIASRYQPGGGYRRFPFSRLVFSRCANALLRWVFPIHPGVKDYTIFMRAYRVGVFHPVVECFGLAGLIQSQGFIANSELLMKIALFTDKIAEVPLVYDYGRKIGKSKMNVLRTINEYYVFIRYMKNLIGKVKNNYKL